MLVIHQIRVEDFRNAARVPQRKSDKNVIDPGSHADQVFLTDKRLCGAKKNLQPNQLFAQIINF